MSDRTALSQWTAIVGGHFPALSRPQVAVLALWSLGMVLARSCALTAVRLLWATGQQRQENTVRQQLGEWCDDAPAKRGGQRRALPVATCVVPPPRWVLAWRQGTQGALALDATGLGERFVVLAVRVLDRGRAIPVAWVVLAAATEHAGKHEWLRLVRALQPAVPAEMRVIVLADRGLHARWLFRRLVRLRWHPLRRVNLGGAFRPAGQARFVALTAFAPHVGATWSGQGTAFASSPLTGTLLATWEADCAAPWLLLTDPLPEAADASRYGLRAWIEQGVKITKRGRLAVAAHPDDRPGARRAAPVGGGRRRPGAAQRRRCGRGRGWSGRARGHAARSHGRAGARTPTTARHTLAARPLLPPRRDHHPLGAPHGRATARRPVRARAVAHRARPRTPRR